MQYINQNNLSSAICDIYDVQNVIKSLSLNDNLKDCNGTEVTIGDCLEDVLQFLQSLEQNDK